MRTLTLLSVVLLAGWGAAQPSNPTSGLDAAAEQPAASSGTARGGDLGTDRPEPARVHVPGAGGTPESLPLPGPMPGVPGPAQGVPGEGPPDTAPRDRTLRPGG